MASNEQDFQSGLELLGEMDRQRAAVLAEFERASLAQVAHMQRMIDENPELIERFVSDLTRASQMSDAAAYLAGLNIPGYESELDGESGEMVRDRAAVVLEIFAPEHPEYATWRDLTEFDFDAAVGRLGATSVPVRVIETTPAPVIDEVSVQTPEPVVDTAPITPTESVDTIDPVEDTAEVEATPETPKVEARQMLYDGTVIPMNEEAADLLVAMKESGERMTIGRMRKALGNDDLDANNIRARIRQVNRRFGEIYEGELIENQGGGWYAISDDNLELVTEQVILIDAAPGTDVEGTQATETDIEVAETVVYTATYKGKTVDLEHEAHYAVLKAIQDGDGVSSEDLKANPEVAAFADQFSENKFRTLPGDAVQSAQRLFESEFGISVTEVQAEGSNLPGEFSEQTGVVHIAGRRRGRRYHSTPTLDAVTFNLEYNAGEVISDTPAEAETDDDAEAKRKAVSAMSLQIFKLLRDSDTHMSQSQIIEAMMPEGTSANQRPQVELLIVQAMTHVREDLTDTLAARGFKLKTSPLHGDTAHYTIVKIEDEKSEADTVDLQDRLDRRRERRQAKPEDGKTETIERAPRVMDKNNKLYPTYALVEGERRQFTPHEAAVVAILGERHYKRGIKAAGIYDQLKPRDPEITIGDIETALTGLSTKLREGWMVAEREHKRGPMTYRFGSKVNVKSHGPRK